MQVISFYIWIQTRDIDGISLALVLPFLIKLTVIRVYIGTFLSAGHSDHRLSEELHLSIMNEFHYLNKFKKYVQLFSYLSHTVWMCYADDTLAVDRSSL